MAAVLDEFPISTGIAVLDPAPGISGRDGYDALVFRARSVDGNAAHALLGQAIDQSASDSERPWPEFFEGGKRYWSARNHDIYAYADTSEGRAVIVQARFSQGDSKKGYRSMKKSYYVIYSDRRGVHSTQVVAQTVRAAVRRDSDPASALRTKKIAALLPADLVSAIATLPRVEWATKGGPSRESGDGYYKAVAVVQDRETGDVAMRSIYNESVVYRLGETLIEPARQGHGGGFYCYRSVESAINVAVPRDSDLGDEPRAILQVRGEGTYCVYDNDKIAFSKLTPVAIAQWPEGFPRPDMQTEKTADDGRLAM